ncbi:hypothetical protein GRI36_03170 [Altererythrobacter gangjinensis]|uniref:SGNH hydrolase-type esterase domain-containing protein n=2 Tax=Pontixanthobacter gangjinensis TaxID=1028742 RepID=A0A6I4SL38_9SPHN|nr:hypothetical protein [Pontixanthobacter gangjinensis]
MPRAHKAKKTWPVSEGNDWPVVMAAPPQIIVGSTPSLLRAWFAGSGSNAYPLASNVQGGHFTFCRGLPDTAAPTLGFKPAPTVSTEPNGTRVPSGQQFSFYHEGASLELHFQNNDRGYLLKIDGEYVSLTPRIDAGQTYSRIDLGTRKLRRFDLITYKAAFAGVWTAVSDTIYAAPVRGPRTICIGDSFTEADAAGWTNWFAESLGWDDVWTSAVGGTGYVNNGNGLALNWQERLAPDVIAYRPEVVFLHGSVNDLAQTPATMYAAVKSLISQLRSALPDAVIAGGMNTPFGVEYWVANNLLVYDAAKQGFLDGGGAWMSTLELPHEFSGDSVGNDASLMDAVAQGRPGNGGAPNILAGQSGFRVNTSSATPATNLRIGSTVEIGSGATRERVAITVTGLSGGRIIYGFDGMFKYAHAAGEPVREVAPSYLTGQGSQLSPSAWGNSNLYVGSDGYHPSAAGNLALGQANAALLKRHLATIGRE